MEVSDEYVQRFIEAESTFKYSWIFDPLLKCVKPLSQYSAGFTCESFPQCGAMLTQSEAYQVALGNVDTKTMEFVNSFSPENLVSQFWSVLLSE